MPEFHAYGKSCLCVSRRHFVLVVCGVVALLCAFRASAWIFQSDAFQRILDGEEKQQLSGCTGKHCYEILSCHGFKDATLRMREPLACLSGLVFFPLGFFAALHGSEAQLRLVATYLWYAAFGHGFLVAFDVAFTRRCAAYPSNVVEELANGINGMTFLTPLSPAEHDALSVVQSNSSTYAIAAVDQSTHGFPILVWYVCVAGGWALLLGYLCYEVRRLAALIETGPLGIGTHYGIDQFDEVINRDALRIAQAKGMHSKFVEDAILPAPAWGRGQYEPPFGYPYASFGNAGRRLDAPGDGMAGYGAAENARKRTSKDADERDVMDSWASLCAGIP